MRVGLNWKSTSELQTETDLVWNTKCMLAQTGSRVEKLEAETDLVWNT